jgi:adenosylmethionine-8-amino-7-oxononanoate aminotransferase
MPEGLDKVFFVSGGSEAVESALKLARQWAITVGEGSRWKVISRFPSYHGSTFGALAVTGYDALKKPFQPMIRDMPHIKAPTAYLDRDNLSLEERGVRYGEDPGGRRLQRARLHHGADRRRLDRRAGSARQLLSSHPRNLRQIRHPSYP